MSVVCPYCGLIFESEIDARTHQEQEHAGLEPLPPIPTPTTDAEWEAIQTAIIVNNQNAQSPRQLIKEGSIRTASAWIGVGASNMAEMEKSLERLSTPVPEEDLKAHWDMYRVEAAVTAGVDASLVAALTLGASIPFINNAYALTQFLYVPPMAAARSISQDVFSLWYNVTERPKLTRYLLSQTKPLIPETYRLALAASQGIIDDAKYEDAMAESGLSQFWAHIWKEQNQQYPTFTTLFSMLWRKTITLDTLKNYLRRQGYKQEVADALLPLAELIPSSSDLIAMVVREAFDPAFVVEAPDVFAENMAKQGFSKIWSDRYWTTHFLPIALTQAYDNLWRGNWDKDKFIDMLRIADIHPKWREDIYNVAFRPPGVREMGYGWDTGKYTMEDIVKYRRMEGLSLEDAQKAAASLIDYRLEAEREALRREWMHLYALGRLSETDFAKNLEAVFDMNSRTELWIERGKLEAQRIAKEGSITEPRIISSSEAIWAFKAGLRTEEWLKGALDALNWNEERINLAVERAKKELEVIPEPEKPVEYRQLSITQIQSLYALGTIDYDGLILELETIGYSPEDAERLAALTLSEVTAVTPIKTWSRADLADMYDLAVIDEDILYEELLNLGYDDYHAAGLTLYIKVAVNLPDIKARYSKGWIDEHQLYYEILNLWYPDERAEALSKTLLSEELRKLWTPEARATTLFETIVAVEKPARTAPEKDLTKAEIIKGAKSGVLSPNEASDLLVDLGYDSDEATYLLLVNAVVAAGDPESYWEMKRITEAHKKALGQPYKDVPQELITYEKQLKELKAEVERLKKEGAAEDVLADALIRLSGAESRYRTIVASWNSGQ